MARKTWKSLKVSSVMSTVSFEEKCRIVKLFCMPRLMFLNNENIYDRSAPWEWSNLCDQRGTSSLCNPCWARMVYNSVYRTPFVRFRSLLFLVVVVIVEV